MTHGVMPEQGLARKSAHELVALIKSRAASPVEVLDAHFEGPLRLDLADLSYVDVAGMRALRAHKGQRLTISPASDAVESASAELTAALCALTSACG